jgi:hypothetical protein
VVSRDDQNPQFQTILATGLKPASLRGIRSFGPCGGDGMESGLGPGEGKGSESNRTHPQATPAFNSPDVSFILRS